MDVIDSPRSTALRASNYTIYVDLRDDGEHVLLVHGYSGAYDKVTSAVARYVRSLDERPPKPLYGTWTDYTAAPGADPPSDATIELLKKRGYLTELTRAAERTRFDRFVGLKHEQSMARMPNYLFMPTYDCNLRCAYCFQDHMRADPAYGHLLRTMTPKVIDRAIASMPGIESRHGLEPVQGRPRSVTFFGGEPLLRRSRPVVEYIMSAMRRLGPTGFSAISNATELDAYEDLLGPDGIAVLQITIDGPKAQHDARRIYADGSGSFDRIADNVDLALFRDVKVDIRLNVDRTNVDELEALAAFFEERGWTKNTGFSAYAAAIHATNGKTEKKTTFNSHQLSEALGEMRGRNPLMHRIGRPDDAMRKNLRALLKHASDPLPMMRSSYCGAHSGMYIFDAFGDIYTCWERTGDKNIRIGWVDETGEAQFVADRLKEWRSRNVSSNDTCGQCRYSMYCGGGCAVLAEDLHGTMFGNYCDAFARRFRQTASEIYAEGPLAEPVDERALELRAL
jgi:uncharacterized protein